MVSSSILFLSALVSLQLLASPFHHAASPRLVNSIRDVQGSSNTLTLGNPFLPIQDPRITLTAVQARSPSLSVSGTVHSWLDIAVKMWISPEVRYVGGTFIDDKCPGITTYLRQEHGVDITTQMPGWIALHLLKGILIKGIRMKENDVMWRLPEFDCYFRGQKEKFATFQTTLGRPVSDLDSGNGTTVNGQDYTAKDADAPLSAALWTSVVYDVRNTGARIARKSSLAVILDFFIGEIFQHSYADNLSQYHVAGTGIHSGPTPAGVNFYVQFLSFRERDQWVSYWFFKEALHELILLPVLKDESKGFEADVFLVDKDGGRSARPFLKFLMTGPQEAMPASWESVVLTEIPMVDIGNATTIESAGDGGSLIASNLFSGNSDADLVVDSEHR